MDLLNHHNKANYIDTDKVGYFRSLTNFTLHPGDEAWMNYGADKSANFKVLTVVYLFVVCLHFVAASPVRMAGPR